MHVYNEADKTTISCPESNEAKCRIQYRFRYTPLLHDVSPSNVYLDQQLSLRINPMASHYSTVIKSDADPVDFIKFSGTRCDSEDLFDNSWRMSSFTVGDLPTRSGDQHPGDSIPEVRFRTGNAYLRDSSMHCNFAGDECWYVRTHPKIDSVSAASGYTTGGQEITISGWGMKGTTLDDIEVLVDGVPCAVTANTLETITCVTGEAAQVSNDGVSQPGSPGLTQELLDGSGWPNWNQRFDGSVTPYDNVLQTAFENNYNRYYAMSTASRGWFKAPATGNYRFYISCDDACNLHLDEANPFDAAAPVEPDMAQKANRSSATEWRHYFMTPETSDSSQYISEWIALAEGEFYKIEGYMMEYSSSDHFTVSVEYEQADTAGHHHANKEIQILRIDQTNIEEKFNIEVSGSVGENYYITFVDPNWTEDQAFEDMIWKSDEIADDCSASSMRNRIKGYFSSVWGSDISVTSVDYDMMDMETDDSDLVMKTIYTVTLLKRINGPSFVSAGIL